VPEFPRIPAPTISPGSPRIIDDSGDLRDLHVRS
jgi:hypothetical protein